MEREKKNIINLFTSKMFVKNSYPYRKAKTHYSLCKECMYMFRYVIYRKMLQACKQWKHGSPGYKDVLSQWITTQNVYMFF